MNTLAAELQARRASLFLELRAIDELLGIYQVKPSAQAPSPAVETAGPAPKRRGGRPRKAEPKPARAGTRTSGTMAETILEACRNIPAPFKPDAVWAVARQTNPEIRNKLVSDTLARMVKAGTLKRAGWGSYTLADLPAKEQAYREFHQTVPTTPPAE